MRSLAHTKGTSMVATKNAAMMAAILIVLILPLAGRGMIGQQPQKKAPPPIFRADVESVFIKVSVTDPLNRYVTGLEQTHFKIYEDKVEQTINYFNQQQAPVSVGIIFDVSGSMKKQQPPEGEECHRALS